MTAAVLGEVDQTGETQTFCNVSGGDVVVTQNAGPPGESGGAGNSENSNTRGNPQAPGQQGS